MLQDLRFTMRLMARERWFTAVAVIALALGIGINATVFTIVHAAFRGLPFEEAGRLRVLSWQARTSDRVTLAYPELLDLRAQTTAFAAIAAFDDDTVNISDDRAFPEQVREATLTANAFGLLRQPPHIGRDFATADERKGAEPVVILGYRLWQTRYGGDPAVLGTVLRVNGQPATIIGVMPDRMNFPQNAEMWRPFMPTAEQEQRSARPLKVFARLQDAATDDTALAELQGLAQRFASAYPDTNAELTGARVETFTARFVGGAARVMFITMMGAVGFVLLIACANVANLLLSRSTQRAREIAVRRALGATRFRILRQLLLESVVLGAIGGGLGLLIAIAAVPMFDAAVTDPGKPYWIVFEVDYVVVSYVAAICVVTGLLFGLAPALHVSKPTLTHVLNDGGRGTVGSGRAQWLSGSMVVMELALTIVLLVGAGLMIRSFLNLYTRDIGFQTDHLMAMRLQLPAEKYATPEARRAFYERLAPRLTGLAGVQSVAVTTSVPPFGGASRLFEIEGRPARAADDTSSRAASVTIGPAFFDAIRSPLRRGRAFDERDGAPGAEHVIINERLAARFFPGEDPIGRRIRFTPFPSAPRAPRGSAAPVPPAPPEPWRTIVGVSTTIWHSGNINDDANPVVYVPLRQNPASNASLLVRSALPPASVMDAVRREVQRVDPDQPVFTIETLDQVLAEARWPLRVFGSLFAIFALAALVLSSVGLYAVMAYSVTQRTAEIGLRMALGAEPGHVSWMVLRRGLVQVTIGLTLGLAGAFALSRVIRRVLVEVTPTDPVTFVTITTLLTLVALAACLLPARRATRVDPLVALRE